MSEIQYPLTCNTWGEEELQAIQKVVDSGMFTMGSKVKEFEAAFADKFNMPYATMVTSGSSANLVGVASLFYKKERPLRAGDEVIVPAISWSTTYYPLSQYGLKLKFVDVELDSLNIDVALLEAAITDKTKMVVAVSILGNPAKLKELRAFCDANGLYLFEDNCESMGAEIEGKLTGTFGDINTFSTFYSHHISTIEGGVVLTESRELHDLAVCMRAHGWTRNLPEDTELYEKKEDDFYEAYRFILPGYNARPQEINGAVGVEQLKKLDGMLALRRENAKHFVELFSNDDRFIIQKEHGSSSWFCFTIILAPTVSTPRDVIFKGLKDAGVEFRIITGGNFLKHDVIKHIEHTVHVGTPNADMAHDRGFFVGNFPYDIKDKISDLYKTLDRLVS